MSESLTINDFDFKIKQVPIKHNLYTMHNIIIPFFNNKDAKTIWGNIAKFRFDRYAFLDSLFANNEFDIFTCTCGEAGCDSFRGSMQVSHEADTITWVFFNTDASPRKVVFPKDVYVNFAVKLQKYIQFEELLYRGYSWSIGLILDPVCFRMINDYLPDRQSVEYNSVKYEFCSSECKNVFLSDPRRYYLNNPYFHDIYHLIKQIDYYFLL